MARGNRALNSSFLFLQAVPRRSSSRPTGASGHWKPLGLPLCNGTVPLERGSACMSMERLLLEASVDQIGFMVVKLPPDAEQEARRNILSLLEGGNLSAVYVLQVGCATAVSCEAAEAVLEHRGFSRVHRHARQGAARTVNVELTFGGPLLHRATAEGRPVPVKQPSVGFFVLAGPVQPIPRPALCTTRGG